MIKPILSPIFSPARLLAPIAKNQRLASLLGLFVCAAGTVFGQAYTFTTLAGSGVAGFVEGPGIVAQFNTPVSVTVDSAGNIYVADANNSRIRKITAAGLVSTVPVSVFLPSGVAADSAGNVYVADYGNYVVRKITPGGTVTTLAGSGSPGFTDGAGSAAQFSSAWAVAVDSGGNVYVADQSNNAIRKVTPSGVVTTLAGSRTAGFADSTGAVAKFSSPQGVAVDSDGNVYVADSGNNRIRKISPAGAVSTLAGSGVAGFADGTGNAAQFRTPEGVAVDSSGNIYVADAGNNRVRKISPTGTVSTLAGSATAGYTDGPGDAVQFNGPASVAVDGTGNLYVADTVNNRIRKGILDSGSPVITSPTIVSATRGYPFSYAITATHAPANYAATGLPAGLTIGTSTGIISGTPTQLGTFNTTLSATNSVGTGTTSFAILVTANPQVTSWNGYLLGNPTTFDNLKLPILGKATSQLPALASGSWVGATSTLPSNVVLTTVGSGGDADGNTYTVSSVVPGPVPTQGYISKVS
ncbi:MAG TPA: putative Ig domain-containing protein, partial [Opitutaceae bacterium]|nr:putative Ig domain-containing protein [Opitutaceae bacterium]